MNDWEAEEQRAIRAGREVRFRGGKGGRLYVSVKSSTVKKMSQGRSSGWRIRGESCLVEEVSPALLTDLLRRANAALDADEGISDVA